MRALLRAALAATAERAAPAPAHTTAAAVASACTAEPASWTRLGGGRLSLARPFAADAAADADAPPSSSKPAARRRDAQSLAAWRRGGGALPALAKSAPRVPGAKEGRAAAAAAAADGALPAAPPAAAAPAFPFSARAHYVGPDAAAAGLSRLRAAAGRAGLPCVWDEPGSVAYCLSSDAPPPPSPTPHASVLPHTARYVAVFAPMGSVVFFNARGYERALWRALAGGDLTPPAVGPGGAAADGGAEGTAGGLLAASKPAAAARAVVRGARGRGKGGAAAPPPPPPPVLHTDDVRVFVSPGLDAPHRLGPDTLTLRSARAAVVKTVACVAAQTVALHYYEAHVDADLAAFRGANAGMADTGSFKAGTSKEALLRAVARNNVIMATIMGGGGGGGGAIGAMSRWDAAWHDAEAAAVYEWLRDDHEIALRLANLELKLSFVQDNLKYFLEIMQNKKSDTLEWTIIVLIAAEIGVSLFDMASKAGGAG